MSMISCDFASERGGSQTGRARYSAALIPYSHCNEGGDLPASPDEVASMPYADGKTAAPLSSSAMVT
jgi:hypothetical protein